jgi:Arc/MetJ-type ribon-helix-helix transcriptional regulator
MRTITLKLPDGLAARVSAAVRRRGVSTSALVREALEERLGHERSDRAGSCLELARDLRGSLRGPADLSSNPTHLRGYGG